MSHICPDRKLVLLSAPKKKKKPVIESTRGVKMSLALGLRRKWYFCLSSKAETGLMRGNSCFAEKQARDRLYWIGKCESVSSSIGSTLCDPVDCSPPGSSVHGIFQARNTGVGCHSLLQAIFPTHGSNPGLPHYKQILYHLSHQGSPYWIETNSYFLFQTFFCSHLYTHTSHP